MTPPGLLAARGKWPAIRANAVSVILFGLLAVAGAQLFFFNAVQSLSVGVALMLEYMGLILVVLWQWLVAGHRPGRNTVIGVGLAIVGLALVLDLFGAAKVDVIGILWGLGAAVGLATYYVVAGSGIRDIPPITMTGAGMVIGGLSLGVAGLLGALPMAVSTDDVELAGSSFPWFVAVGALGLVTGALAYSSGVVAAGRLGAKLSAFVGLTEVLFAVVFAWILLGQLPEGTQLVGGVFIVAGIAVVRREELRGSH